MSDWVLDRTPSDTNKLKRQPSPEISTPCLKGWDTPAGAELLRNILEWLSPKLQHHARITAQRDWGVVR